MGDALLPMPGGMLSQYSGCLAQPILLYQIEAEVLRTLHVLLCLLRNRKEWP